MFKEICARSNDSELKKLEDSGKKFINFNALVKKYSEEAILTIKEDPDAQIYNLNFFQTDLLKIQQHHSI